MPKDWWLALPFSVPKPGRVRAGFLQHSLYVDIHLHICCACFLGSGHRRNRIRRVHRRSHFETSVGNLRRRRRMLTGMPWRFALSENLTFRQQFKLRHDAPKNLMEEAEST